MHIKRAFLVVLDSVGAGDAPDAALYGDEGANTLGNIARSARLDLPNMKRIGLGHIASTYLGADPHARGAYGRMTERSAGKDTTTGHWEMSGVTLSQPFPTYPNGFPEEVISAFTQATGYGVLGNKTASGTEILKELGEEHLRTGKLIVYTSADSVFQIAAHEEKVPVEELYRICLAARKLLQGPHGVGRVIARPFLGKDAGSFFRTPHRKDFSLEPTAPTILDVLSQAGLDTLAVGKIEDIFCMKGISQSVHSAGNPACLLTLLDDLQKDFHGLCFVNLVDTDSVYGHRRDVAGYAQSLMEFDAFMPYFARYMGPEDMLFITADHGCDPTYRGTDHTRERVPLLCWGPRMTRAIPLGDRSTFADLAATIAEGFGLPERFGAESFWAALEEK